MLAWSTPTVHHYSEPHTALACAVMGSRFGRTCTTVWPAFVKRSRSSARLPDTFMPSFRSSSRSLRTVITGKFACLCSPVSIYTGQGKAGSCQNFAREAALSMGGETRFSSSNFSCRLAKKEGWPQRREGKARAKFVQRISCLGMPGKGIGGAAANFVRGELLACEERGAAWGCSY